MNEAVRIDRTQSEFVDRLASFLDGPAPSLAALANAWQRVCDVPREVGAQEHELSNRHVLMHLNTFRNRFAHVPFPYDPLDDLANALELITDEVFRDSVTNSTSALCGGFWLNGMLLVGNQSSSVEPHGDSGARFVSGCSLRKDYAKAESWSSVGLVHVDQMARPYALTRYYHERDSAEYTRFRAEGGSVVWQQPGDLATRIPALSEAEYRTEEPERDAAPTAPEETAGTVGTRPVHYEDALQAIREDDFQRAVQLLLEITQRRPSYHVAWLRFGHAQRELAVRIRWSDEDGSLKLVRESIASLTKAAEHVDPEYRADAFYERSKSHVRLASWDAGQAKNETDKAIADAKAACNLSSRERFRTWLDWLQGNHSGLD